MIFMTIFFGKNTNVIKIICLFVNCCKLKNITICVNDLKRLSSIIIMEMFQNIFTSFKFPNYNLLYLSCWLRGKSSTPLLNEKLKLVNSCVKYDVYEQKNISKVVGYCRKRIYLTEHLLLYYFFGFGK